MINIEPRRKVEAQKPEGDFNGILIIGEAPGEQEDKKGIPFVGMAGNVLDGMLQEAGIKRPSCYITNLYKYRPEENNFESIDPGELAKGLAELQEEILITKPNVIVTLGEHAMNALTGLRNITKHRGSILNTKFGKVIPTIHPAAILREWSYRPLAVVDLKKALKESTSPEYKITTRITHVCYDFKEAVKRLVDLMNCDTVAFDIEVETQQICSIAFAASTTEAFTIPFWFGASGSIFKEEDELVLWTYIKTILTNSGIKKIAQNAQYDMTILRDKYDIEVKGLWLDTMIAFHAIYPELPKGLDLLCSLYTDIPYYKHLRLTKDMTEFFVYNATDAIVTYECAIKIYEEMKEMGVVDFYYEHMHSLIEPLMYITSIGVKLDVELKKKAIKEINQQMIDLQTRLDTMVGHPLNVNSPKQMKTWLYDELGLSHKYKLRKDKGEKTVSADEEALEELYKETQNEALKIVLDIRNCKKLLSTYLEAEYDKEEGMERARTSYLITGTETGRLSSRETVYRTGTNLQNVPKGIIRRIFIPDVGKTFINADLSQAEARVVAYLAGENRLIQVFESGGDIHRKNAANIFKKRETEVTEKERELAKRIIHASNYGMGPVTFAKTAGLPVGEAKKLLNIYFAEYPKIKLWQMQIASQLRNSRILTTPFGRKRVFFNRWNESLLKEAYAYIPQSTVADLLNLGLRRAYDRFKGSDTQILLQIHDAILVQCPTDRVQEIVKTLRICLDNGISINGRVLHIPVDISVGDNWDSLHKIPNGKDYIG